jgi:hypothetical protein
MQKRAKAGGEIGMNGETYAGGTFLPRTQLSKMAKASRRSGSRKVEIEPFKWVEARDGFRPILGKFPYHPAKHLEMKGRICWTALWGCSAQDAEQTVATLDALHAAWMQGERWVVA